MHAASCLWRAASAHPPAASSLAALQGRGGGGDDDAIAALLCPDQATAPTANDSRFARTASKLICVRCRWCASVDRAASSTRPGLASSHSKGLSPLCSRERRLVPASWPSNAPGPSCVLCHLAPEDAGLRIRWGRVSTHSPQDQLGTGNLDLVRRPITSVLVGVGEGHSYCLAIRCGHES
ncbi:uncharacterized protein B0I36DRAFT_347212 [Microdochium trichocladiopsis]|uniref:Uncharacterized protein n=1 Tax=Microdochium trichocladiopsis TaxID=1682393 RepID=A0A9P8YE96_9PEZI|nr:uncharacterized protein B0I36DRAFT_347212 [Microdochium trichocladiopsis]KAH7035433.1 hypothetical protein B0I36DRAFT_347212 [Microdochium trichocladiopsis]